MTEPRNPIPSYDYLHRKAIECCTQWRAWAQREPKNSAQARRAFEVAALFEKQATLFAAMHRNRVEWQRIEKADAEPGRSN